jgi:hypothetical protein
MNIRNCPGGQSHPLNAAMIRFQATTRTTAEVSDPKDNRNLFNDVSSQNENNIRAASGAKGVYPMGRAKRSDQGSR